MKNSSDMRGHPQASQSTPSHGDVGCIVKIDGRSGKSAGNHLSEMEPQRLSDEHQVRLARKHYVNEGFFKTMTPKSAYVLGLVFSDGNITQHHRCLSFSSKDKDLLELVRELIETSAEIRYEHNKNGEWWNLYIYRKALVETLLPYGVTPAKSKTIIFPKLPEEVLPDFIRGVFDGDGCIRVVKKWNRPSDGLEVSFCTASRAFADGLHDALLRLLGKEYLRLYTNKRGYHYITGAVAASKALYPVMYYEKNLPKLERKFQLYSKLVDAIV